VDNKAKVSFSLMKIGFISLIILFGVNLGVRAFDLRVNDVKIIFPNGYEMNVVTTKTVISDILEENNIVILPNERTETAMDAILNENRTIKIVQDATLGNINVKLSSLEEILANYKTITEKIVKEQVTIPYETVTKDVSDGGSTLDTVIQHGQEGIREVTYKVTYENDIEIKKEEISSITIKEPVDKIIQKQAVASRSGSYTERTEGNATVTTLNASAYTASTCGKAPTDPGYGRTASGNMATALYTVATSSDIPIGTRIYIPYFASYPNGGWFTVEDRGVYSGQIDIYMDTYNECIQFGRRNLECYIYY